MTNWDEYYQNPVVTTSVTRKISERKIGNLLLDYVGDTSVSIGEIGGANSCFAEGICDMLNVNKYHVIDSNAYGLDLLNNKTEISDVLSWELGDVIYPKIEANDFDIIYSVGLIEHFEPIETAIAIKTHFELCKAGGIVLITFPTPTMLYKTIRKSAELLNMWAFSDERPLQFDEVINEGQKHGDLLHRSINWKIGLTQGYLVWKKR